MINYYLNAIFISNAHTTHNIKTINQAQMCLCVAFAQLSLYSSIWGASVGLNIGSGDLNSVKFDIANPDKITKIAKSYSLRQEFKCICIHFICICFSH